MDARSAGREAGRTWRSMRIRLTVLAGALALLALAGVPCSAALAATGDIIAPQNNPHTPADGWQAGHLHHGHAHPVLGRDPESVLRRSLRPPAGGLHPVHGQIHRRPAAGDENPGRRPRQGPRRPPGRADRQPPGDAAVRRNRRPEQMLDQRSPLTGGGQRRHPLRRRGRGPAGAAADRSPGLQPRPRQRRTGAVRAQPRRQQRLPESRRRLGRRLPRGVRHRRSRTAARGTDPDQSPHLQRPLRRRHLHHHPVDLPRPRTGRLRGDLLDLPPRGLEGRTGIGRLRLPAERRAAVRIAAARRQKADRLRERPLRTDRRGRTR